MAFIAVSLVAGGAAMSVVGRVWCSDSSERKVGRKAVL
jgi:hypothetical protein